jgi:hypothetical protein
LHSLWLLPRVLRSAFEATPAQHEIDGAGLNGQTPNL